MTGNIFIHVHNVISQPPNTNNIPKFNDVLPFYVMCVYSDSRTLHNKFADGQVWPEKYKKLELV